MSNFRYPYEHTKRFSRFTAQDVYSNEKVILAKNALEERDELPLWRDLRTTSPDKLININEHGKEHIHVERHGFESIEISLRDEDALKQSFASENVLIDISGLPHYVWAPILKACYEAGVSIRVLYAEPETYKHHSTPSSATLFDLSDSFEGLAPLPGFARLAGPEDETKCLFIALLGFEGNRPQRLIDQIDPPPIVIPVVGVPGFQIEYPSFTVACNRFLFREHRAHSNLRFARASCPFDVFTTLNDIKIDYPDHYMYLALVGTKPHALGAIWYSIINPGTTEIMFDYPIKKKGRTRGIGTIHIYDFGAFDVS